MKSGQARVARGRLVVVQVDLEIPVIHVPKYTARARRPQELFSKFLRLFLDGMDGGRSDGEDELGEGRDRRAAAEVALDLRDIDARQLGVGHGERRPADAGGRRRVDGTRDLEDRVRIIIVLEVLFPLGTERDARDIRQVDRIAIRVGQREDEGRRRASGDGHGTGRG